MYNKLYYIGAKGNTALYANLNNVVILSSDKIDLEDLKNIEISAFYNAISNTTQYGSLNNEYKRLLDSVLMLPADKLEMVREEVLEYEKKD